MLNPQVEFALKAMISERVGYNKSFVIHELDLSDEKTIEINKSDKLTAFKLNVEYDRYLGLWYEIYFAIEEFIPPYDHGIMEVEKGIAKLYCNADLSAYDLSIYYVSMYEMS